MLALSKDVSLEFVMPCGVRVTDRGLAPVAIETISGLALIGRRTGPLGKVERFTLDWTEEL